MKKPGEFKLILINNRDEFFHRPSNSASFVTNENIYGKFCASVILLTELSQLCLFFLSV